MYPGAFNFTTGPAHYKHLQRARAIDYQMYVVGVSPARNPTASYQSWAHSQITSPWGKIVAQAVFDPEILTATISTEHIQEVRTNIPVSVQLRPDLYTLLVTKSMQRASVVTASHPATSSPSHSSSSSSVESTVSTRMEVSSSSSSSGQEEEKGDNSVEKGPEEVKAVEQEATPVDVK